MKTGRLPTGFQKAPLAILQLAAGEFAAATAFADSTPVKVSFPPAARNIAFALVLSAYIH